MIINQIVDAARPELQRRDNAFCDTRMTPQTREIVTPGEKNMGLLGTIRSIQAGQENITISPSIQVNPNGVNKSMKFKSLCK
jgi:hypothetical protein